jgi:hypothetical protein
MGFHKLLGEVVRFLVDVLTVLEHRCGVLGEAGYDPGFPGCLGTLGTLLVLHLYMGYKSPIISHWIYPKSVCLFIVLVFHFDINTVHPYLGCRGLVNHWNAG